MKRKVSGQHLDVIFQNDSLKYIEKSNKIMIIKDVKEPPA